MTLTRAYRVPRDQLKNIAQSGHRFKSGSVRLSFRENLENHSRIAVVIPSKAAKSSVVRNKLRRRTKEIFRKINKRFRKNYDIVVFFYSVGSYKFEEFEKMLAAVFLEAKIVR